MYLIKCLIFIMTLMSINVYGGCEQTFFYKKKMIWPKPYGSSFFHYGYMSSVDDLSDREIVKKYYRNRPALHHMCKNKNQLKLKLKYKCIEKQYALNDYHVLFEIDLAECEMTNLKNTEDFIDIDRCNTKKCIEENLTKASILGFSERFLNEITTNCPEGEGICNSVSSFVMKSNIDKKLKVKAYSHLCKMGNMYSCLLLKLTYKNSTPEKLVKNTCLDGEETKFSCSLWKLLNNKKLSLNEIKNSKEKCSVSNPEYCLFYLYSKKDNDVQRNLCLSGFHQTCLFDKLKSDDLVTLCEDNLLSACLEIEKRKQRGMKVSSLFKNVDRIVLLNKCMYRHAQSCYEIGKSLDTHKNIIPKLEWNELACSLGNAYACRELTQIFVNMK